MILCAIWEYLILIMCN